jgi:phosphonopyruvate decarboxylase
MVVMQNSGLGVSLNALGSLHLLYEIPALLLVTWRGYEGKDAPEHLPYRVPTLESIEGDIDWAVTLLHSSRKPVALVVRPGLFG